MSAADLYSGHIDHRILRMERPVGELIRLLDMHDLINAAVNLEQTRIDQRRIADTADDRHLCSADNMCVQPTALYKVFYP